MLGSSARRAQRRLNTALYLTGGFSVADALRITGIDEARTQPIEFCSQMYVIYLKLSGHPTPDWRRAFDERRKFPRHSMWRNAWVDGDYVVINCPLDELKAHHLDDLKADVEVANQQAAAVKATLAAAADEYERQQAAERERVRRLKDDLQF